MKFPLVSKVSRSTARRLGLSLIASLMVLGGFFAYQATGQRESKRQRPKTQTVAVRTQNLSVKVTASGSVVPVQEVNLSPKMSGRLVKLFVDQGDRVEAGQIVAQMDDRDIQAQVRQQKASVELARAKLAEARAGSRSEEVAQAQAQVTAAQSQVNLTQERTVRYQNLFRQGAIAKDQLDETLANAQSAQANLQQTQKRVEELKNGTRIEQVDQAEAQLAQAEAALQSVQVQAEDMSIRSPLSGIVSQKYANVGAFVTPTTSASATSSATSTSIVAVASNLEVLAKIAETDISQIKTGQAVEIQADAFPGQTFKGRVRLVAPSAVVEQNVTSYQVRVTLGTGQQTLKAGMNVDLSFVGDQLNDALVIPTVAIVTQQGKTGVMVADDKQQPQFRPVTIGVSQDEDTQVLQGLKLGEQVFVYQPKSPRQGEQGSPVRFR